MASLTKCVLGYKQNGFIFVTSNENVLQFNFADFSLSSRLISHSTSRPKVIDEMGCLAPNERADGRTKSRGRRLFHSNNKINGVAYTRMLFMPSAEHL